VDVVKKVVVLNGSPRKNGSTAALVGEISKVATEQGAQVKDFYLNGMDIYGCQSCYSCKKEGRCVLEDGMQEIYDDIATADALVFATPVYMWQMTAQLKLAMDRLYPFLKPDYTSYLTPGKKVLLAVTQGRPDPATFHPYFDNVGKMLSFLGFGAYQILIAGGTRTPENLLAQPAVLAEARKMGGWLAE
jgi:multimeric flavodoxin WrbA